MSDPTEKVKQALGARYAIERSVGEGGMATVYLADDLKHHRQVAIKVLRPDLAAVLGAERFLREIRTTANLQHPHILPLFDSGEAGSFLFYVMPFVEGESLRDRLDREKELGVEESVRITTEVASALDYAHRHGVIHRDVKPANILLHDGSALVTDFGIALAVRNAGAERITETGLSLGTPYYMSPEQATGDRDIGARSDIYSLAAVLYEMLAGEPPHAGGTVQAVIAKVLTEPVRPLDELRESVPPHVALAVAQALAKIPADRFVTAVEFAEALRNPAFGLSRGRASTSVGASIATARRVNAAAIGMAAFVLGGLAGWLIHRPAAVPAPPVVRFEIRPDSGQLMEGVPAISPDGTTIVYEVSSGSEARLMVRRTDETESHPLPGSDGGVAPFFSPDGEWVAFGTGTALRKTRLDGGTPTPVATLSGFFAGGSWGADNSIVYAVWPQGRLYRIPSSGGRPTPIVLPDSTIRAMWPVLLPDGGTLLFQAIPIAKPDAHTMALDLATGTLHDLGPKRGTRFVRPDALVYVVASGELLWQRFDFSRYDSIGPALQIAPSVAIGSGVSGFTASESGTVAYTPGVSWSRNLVLLDRDGAETLLASGPGIWAPRFSPDSRRVAYGAYPQGKAEADLWIRDLSGGASQRLTYEGRDSNDPTWSPDGKHIAFSAIRDSLQKEKDLFIQAVGGDGSAEPLVTRPGTQWTSDWSRDGSTIVYTEVSNSTSDDIWSTSVGGGEPRPLLVTPFAEEGARLSPDGSWVAYTSNETGRDQVYVQAFPTLGNKIVVSEDGGRDPAWRGDGRELYYWHQNQLVAAELTPTTPLKVKRRDVLFSKNYLTGIHANYDVTNDGQHFVLVTGGASSNGLTVVLNAVERER
ncbi:MAG: serine/threonine-protein kinase [Gemmatimonadetes bacterium]|nr:serine/threonine-protein kinase [Gemmatimonadota bacterium]